MTNNAAYTPTPQELSETVKTMTVSQKIQFDAILSMVTSLLINVHQASIASGTKEEKQS